MRESMGGSKGHGPYKPGKCSDGFMRDAIIYLEHDSDGHENSVLRNFAGVAQEVLFSENNRRPETDDISLVLLVDISSLLVENDDANVLNDEALLPDYGTAKSRSSVFLSDFTLETPR